MNKLKSGGLGRTLMHLLSKIIFMLGINQGDSLSLFSIERFSDCMLAKGNTGNWIPISMGRNGPKISFYFFADAKILVPEALTIM